MKKRRVLSFVSIILVLGLLMLTACLSWNVLANSQQNSNSAKPRVLKLGHKSSENHSWHKASQMFAQLVEEETKGAIKIELYPNAQLGDQHEMTEAAQVGVVDIVLDAPAELASFVPEFAFFDLPFLFRDYEHAFKALDTVGWEYDKYLVANDLKLLAYWNTGFKSLSNSKKEIKDIKDINGLKIRLAGNPALIDTIRAIGGNAITVPWSETYIALQQGTADAQFNPPSTMVENKIHEVQKYYSPNLVIQYGAEPVVMSLKTWNSLTPEQQQVFLKAADKAKEYQRKLSLEDDEKALQTMKDYGCVVTQAPEQVVKDLMELSAPVVAKYGNPEVIKRIKEVK